MDLTNSISNTDKSSDLSHIWDNPTQIVEVVQEFPFEQISGTESKNAYNGQSVSSSEHKENFDYKLREQIINQEIANSTIATPLPPPSSVENYQFPYFINQDEIQFPFSQDPVPVSDIVTNVQPSHIGSTIINKTQKSQAHISIIRTPSGVSKAIVKRKRKRTAFTTDQVAFLEEFFRSKPYITREERKKLTRFLQVSDTSVKIWFQNRRMKVKKENDPVLYYSSDSPSEGFQYNTSQYADFPPEFLEENKTVTPIYSDNAETTVFYSNNEVLSDSGENTIMYPEYSMKDNISLACATINLSNLDYIESQINQNPDENGFITLSESTVTELVNIIDNFVPDNLDLILPASGTEDVTMEFNNTIYEPISPANHSECSTSEEESRWEPVEPKAPLQHLFDLQERKVTAYGG